MAKYMVDTETGTHSEYTFNAYQKTTGETAIFPEKSTGSLPAITYCALGLAGEAGEVANKVKKLVRDGDSKEKRKAIAKEVGDCLWYISRLLDELDGIPMEQVAMANIENLLGRKQRGTLHGDGDNR